MKKNLFYLFMLMAVVVMPLTSCEKNGDSQPEEGQHDPNSDADQTEITAYDALSWLQDNLVVVSENNEIIRRIFGAALDESQPDVISVPVADYGAAEKLFLTWVAPGKQAIKVDDGYDYPLTDMEGKAQGSVSFRSADGDGGVVARMTVSEDTDLKQISEVKFIDKDLWPENAAYEKVEAGKIYEMEGKVFTWTSTFWGCSLKEAKTELLPFYCIQGNTDGKEGILVWISPDCNDDGDILHHPGLYYYMRDAFYDLPTKPQAQKVLTFYNNNTAFWNNMLKEMDAKGYEWSAQDADDSTGNLEFALQGTIPGYMGSLVDVLDLDNAPGKIAQGHTSDGFWYRYMHIKTIPAVAE